VSGSPRRYQVFPAHIRARARRSRPRKLAEGSAVRAEVVRLLRLGYPPGQVTGRLRRDHPDDMAMRGEPRDDRLGAVRAGQGRHPPALSAADAERPAVGFTTAHAISAP